MDDDNEPITFDWVASNFGNMGAAYSARRRADLPELVWQNRAQRFVLNGEVQQLKTRGDVRKLVTSLGCSAKLDRPPDPNDRRFDCLAI